MLITLTPMRRDDVLTLERQGDRLIVNGQLLDFSALPEGGWQDAGCDWIVGGVTRHQGAICLTLILPHGAAAPPETLNPAPLHLGADGPVALPPPSAASGPEE